MEKGFEIAVEIEGLIRSTDDLIVQEWACECVERAFARERADGREPWLELCTALEMVQTRVKQGEYPRAEKPSKVVIEACNAAYRTPGAIHPKAGPAAWAVVSLAQGHWIDAAECAAREGCSEDLTERQWQLDRLKEMNKGNVAS